MNWSSLTTQGRIDAIKAVWQPGMSAAQIAAHFDGVSRNAIIGIFHRHANKVGTMRLNPKGTNGQEEHRPKLPRAQPRKAKASNNLAWRVQRKLSVVKPEPAIERATFGAPQTAGILLTMLDGHRCKWPINDGGPFLFCGEVTKEDRPYCPFHATAAVGQGTESERSADRALKKLAA